MASSDVAAPSIGPKGRPSEPRRRSRWLAGAGAGGPRNCHFFVSEGGGGSEPPSLSYPLPRVLAPCLRDRPQGLSPGPTRGGPAAAEVRDGGGGGGGSTRPPSGRMKRRNADCSKLRRPLKRNRITEGIYGR